MKQAVFGTETLFKVMTVEAMLHEVQKRVEDVAGLNKLAWLLVVDHIVHHVNDYRKEKHQANKMNKRLTNKLRQLKLGKLTKQKKDKMKGAVGDH